MPEFWTMLAVVLTALLSMLGGLAIRESHDLMPHFAAWIVKALAQRMPGEHEERQMYAEMWTADLEKVPGKMLKLGWALGLLQAPWNAWRDEYECSPLMIRLALWNKARTLNFWLQLFPAAVPPTTAERGRQGILRLSLKCSETGQFDRKMIAQTMKEMDPREFRAGLLYLICSTPRLRVDRMVQGLINMPGLGVPAEHQQRLYQLLPVSLKELVIASAVAHQDDPLYQSVTP